MKYEDFRYDLSNLIFYHDLNYKFCYDQMFYDFKDKYYNYDWFDHIRRLYSENNNDNWIKIMNDLLKSKNNGKPIYVETILNN